MGDGWLSGVHTSSSRCHYGGISPAVSDKSIPLLLRERRFELGLHDAYGLARGPFLAFFLTFANLYAVMFSRREAAAAWTRRSAGGAPPLNFEDPFETLFNFRRTKSLFEC
jgi:hypothetical protein